jgi:hypothetical protein
MSIAPLELILPEDTLAEGQEKINFAITRVNLGEFNTISVASDLRVDGRIFVNELIVTQTQTVNISEPQLVLSEYENEETAVSDNEDRGIEFRYVIPGEGVKRGFFGWSGLGNSESDISKFKFIPDAAVTGGVYTGTKGILNARIEASDILNAANLGIGLQGTVVGITTSDVITGQKTITNFLFLTNAGQGNQPTHALTAARTISTTDGILIDGGTSANLTANRVLGLDSTVVRTSGNQTINGVKTFSSIVVSDTIIGQAQTVTNGVYTVGNQTIFDSKVFKRSAGRDGIRLWAGNFGSSDNTISITTGAALTGNRSLILADSDTTLVGGTMVSTTLNQTIDSTKTFSQNILFSDSGTQKRGIQGTVGTNDFWFVGGRAASADAGFMEIATGDDGTEPIFARQYVGSPISTTDAVRTFVILSSDGNTIAPGTITLGTQATNTGHAVRADRTITAGTGLSGGGNLTANRSLSVDFTEVVRTSTNQSISGIKTFTGTIIASDTIQGNSSTATKLRTPVQINGVNFDGSSDITIGTAILGIFYESLQVLTADYVVPTDRNALAVGPLTISGGSASASAGSTLTII